MNPTGHQAAARAADAAEAQAAADDAVWVARAPRIDPDWFARPWSLHGIRHTQRVHIHAQRLTRELGWAELDAQLALRAALWHDIGRTNDGVDDGHGEQSAFRAGRLSLTDALAPADAGAVLFAVFFHSLPDQTAREEAPRWHDELGWPRAGRLQDPEQALRILWLLKDADALDRVRLGPWEAADPRLLRHQETASHLPFAAALFKLLS